MHIGSARSRTLAVITSACALAVAALLPGSGGAIASSKAADIESKVNALLAKMTVDEKLAQLQQMVGNGTDVQDAAKAGKVGAVFGVTDATQVNQIQRLAIEGSRLHIPILFGYDT